MIVQNAYTCFRCGFVSFRLDKPLMVFVRPAHERTVFVHEVCRDGSPILTRKPQLIPEERLPVCPSCATRLGWDGRPPR